MHRRRRNNRGSMPQNFDDNSDEDRVVYMENEDEPIPSGNFQVQTHSLNIDDDVDSNGDGDEDISPFDTSTMMVQKPKMRRPVIVPVQKSNGEHISSKEAINLDIAPRFHRNPIDNFSLMTTDNSIESVHAVNNKDAKVSTSSSSSSSFTLSSSSTVARPLPGTTSIRYSIDTSNDKGGSEGTNAIQNTHGLDKPSHWNRGPKVAKSRKSSTMQKKIVRHSTSAPLSVGLSHPSQRRQSSPVEDNRLAASSIIATMKPTDITTTTAPLDTGIVAGLEQEGQHENEHEVQAVTSKLHSQMPLSQTQSSSSGLSFKPAFLRQTDVLMHTQREDIVEVDNSAEENSGQNFGIQVFSSNDNSNDITALFGSPNTIKLSHSSVPASHSPTRQKGHRYSSKRDNMNSLSSVLRKVLNNSKTDQIWMMNIGKIHDKRSMQDPRNRSKLFIDTCVVQDGATISPFVEALMIIRGVTQSMETACEDSEGATQCDDSTSGSFFRPDMLIRAVFHQASVQDPEKELVRDRVYRIYDPHILYDFHTRDSSLTLIQDVEVPTVICTQLLEVLSEG